MAYQYNKINFKDLIVPEPHRYTIGDEGSEVTKTVIIKENFGPISQEGTLVNAENLNHMEAGIFSAITGVNSSLLPWEATVSYPKGKCVYLTVEDSLKFFISLKDNNTGKSPLTEDTYWKEVEMSGNGYDWIGTLDEYNAAKEAGEIESTWICMITDDTTSNVTVQIDDTTASSETVYSSAKIESILGDLESILGTI